MHPRLTILLSQFEPADVARAGGIRVGLSARRIVPAEGQTVLAQLARYGLALTHISQPGLVPIGEPHLMERGYQDLMDAIDKAAALGAGIVYGPTGGAPALEWDDAADVFAARIAPAVRRARERDVLLLIEPTIMMIAHLSIVHTLRDTIDLAERTGLGVCLDVHHVWAERDLRGAITRAGPRIGLVQLSDWIPGISHHFRAVPGTGAIPLERIVGWILDTGYQGLFDLELRPDPKIPDTDTLARAIDHAGSLLARLGA